MKNINVTNKLIIGAIGLISSSVVFAIMHNFISPTIVESYTDFHRFKVNGRWAQGVLNSRKEFNKGIELVALQVYNPSLPEPLSDNLKSLINSKYRGDRVTGFLNLYFIRVDEYGTFIFSYKPGEAVPEDVDYNLDRQEIEQVHNYVMSLIQKEINDFSINIEPKQENYGRGFNVGGTTALEHPYSRNDYADKGGFVLSVLASGVAGIVGIGVTQEKLENA